MCKKNISKINYVDVSIVYINKLYQKLFICNKKNIIDFRLPQKTD